MSKSMPQTATESMTERLCANRFTGDGFTIGWFGRADPFVLYHIKEPSDQQLLAYRNSAYAHVSWVVSPSDNVAELRFFNRVEGGVCLELVGPICSGSMLMVTWTI